MGGARRGCCLDAIVEVVAIAEDLFGVVQGVMLMDKDLRLLRRGGGQMVVRGEEGRATTDLEEKNGEGGS